MEEFRKEDKKISNDTPVQEEQAAEENCRKTRKPYRRRGIRLLRGELPRLDRRSVAWMLVITVVYAALAFFRIGTTQIPQTSITLVNNKQKVTVELEKPQEITGFAFYKWEGRKDDIKIETYSPETEEWSVAYGPSELSSHMRWRILNGSSFKSEGVVGRVCITFEGKKISLAEVVVLGKDDKPCPIRVPEELNEFLQYREGESLESLTDEQSLFDPDASSKTYAYFDEYLYALTAYDYLNGGKGLENTHPVLGKVLMALGISIFGMNSYGWRFFGTLSGVLMLPVMFFLARRVLRNNKWALVATFLMAVECMHYTQTRLATIDSFPLLFILLGYLFMMRYYQMPTPKGESISLFLSGASFGLACAFKWIGAYAGVGLAICFFVFFVSKCRMYKEENNDFSVVRYLVKTFSGCILFFVIIPAGIYTLSYIPVAFGKYEDIQGWKGIWDNQTYMWNFHSTLKQTFNFSSKWWQWPIMSGSFSSYSATGANGSLSRIIVTGNPVIWWCSVPAVEVCIYFFLCGRRAHTPLLDKPSYKREKGSNYKPVKKYVYYGAFDSGLMVALVAYLCQYVPWMLITRECFIYHYFASSQISILLITWIMTYVEKRFACGKQLVRLYVGLAVIAFIGMFPILNGLYIPSPVMKVLKYFLY